MVASRSRPKGVRAGPFGLSALAFTLLPTQIGFQDIASLFTRQPAVTQRARAHALASPFGTIHAATFRFPQPVGTAIPEPPVVQLASLGFRHSDVTGSIPRDFAGAPTVVPRAAPEFPSVNRRLKGDLLIFRPQPEVSPEPQPGTRDLTPGRVKTVAYPRPGSDAPLPAEPWEAARGDNGEPTTAPPSSYSLASLPAPKAALPRADDPAVDPLDSDDPKTRLTWLYFGKDPVGDSTGPFEWPLDERLMTVAPDAGDPDLKRPMVGPGKDSSVPGIPGAGETVAPKGVVTGPDQRPKTPAERLKLDSKARAKAEKCLAEAVYFESRGETKRGQIAVAQVVMNRVFSGFYPNDVCGVVYQNAHRHLACQFTFACDNVKDVVNEPEMWDQAKQIARDMLDGKFWLTDVGKSTHYHASWVYPWWVRTMRKLSRIGVHTFYRPHRWGDGADAPIWGPGVTVAPGITPENVKL
jgi:hypothetical protein